MATISKYSVDGGARYEVRYRKPDGKTTRRRGFKTKREAEAFASTLEVAKLRGDYVAPSAGRVTVGELYARWIVLKGVLKESSRTSLASAWATHVAPAWASVQVGAVQKSAVQAWVTELSARRSPTVVLRAHGVLAGVLDLAVDDGLVSANRARGVQLPKKGRGHHAYLTWEQLERLVAEAGPRGDFVLFLATTGLRWGEAIALQGRHIDRRRGRVRVERSAAQISNRLVLGTPKTHEIRTVPVPASVLARVPLALPDVLVWQGEDGQMLRRPSPSSGWWEQAVRRCMAGDPLFPRVRPHDMRHTAASLAVSAGANVKVVQRMLGHASAAQTLDQYADLFDDDLDAVAVALDQSVSKMCPRAV